MVILNADPKNLKQKIESKIDNMVADFVYYDRQLDEDLPEGSIEEAIECEIITQADIVKYFKSSLEEGLRE